jgi:oligopeptide/dipeptide ABC transporter ATP-binding protein
MRLIPLPGRIVSGKILFSGDDLLQLSERQMRRIRGRSMTMVFQDPLTTLNPVLTMGYQIAEVLRTHRWQAKIRSGYSTRRTIKERVIELMRLVHIPSPQARYRQYPYELSGGMRQRAIIAAGLACKPQLLIADEPTTALDVTVETQILELLAEIKEKHQTSILLITHNLGAVGYLCDKVAVMYAGKIVEHGLCSQLLKSAKHPYTQGLLKCLPQLRARKDMRPIPGEVPDLLDLPQGCSFQDRCPQVIKRCRIDEPKLNIIQQGWSVRCHLFSSEEN